jgi:hypothetical protein
LAGDRRKITVMKEELQSFAEPTGRLRPCVREPAKPSPLSIIPAYAASFLKSNYGDELKRIPVILKHSLHERNSWRIRSGGVVG